MSNNPRKLTIPEKSNKAKGSDLSKPHYFFRHNLFILRRSKTRSFIKMKTDMSRVKIEEFSICYDLFVFLFLGGGGCSTICSLPYKSGINILTP